MASRSRSSGPASDEPAWRGRHRDAGAGSYKEQYGVIVVCSSETDQAEIYERLKGEGLTVKVVTTSGLSSEPLLGFRQLSCRAGQILVLMPSSGCAQLRATST